MLVDSVVFNSSGGEDRDGSDGEGSGEDCPGGGVLFRLRDFVGTLKVNPQLVALVPSER